MCASATSHPPGPFGSGEFEFGEWPTPFTDAAVEILDVTYGLQAQDARSLVARVRTRDPQTIYRIEFAAISAMRLVDEGGLVAFWQKTAELGGRPGRTTFRVRNHAWTLESVVSFLATDGWSFVIASDDECLEVVSATAPTITAE
jgi:hypothetical protein